MRKLRVTASMKKQLADLRDRRTGGLLRGGVMHVPRILSCDEWETLASVQQDALMQASDEDRARPEEVVVTTAPDTNAESERDYQEQRAIAARGGLDLVREKERQVRQVTR